ncbi:MAG TPA: hypothetical protein VJ810_19825 [Blastocatellia bacterium]|nr:hypothetical protein [Blastocatellia bacterium]
MKRLIIIAITVGLFGLGAMASQAQAQTPNPSAENQAALLNKISAELRQLRLEVVQQAIEFQNWKIQRLEREIPPIQSERQRLVAQEEALSQLTAELEKNAGLDKDKAFQEGKITDLEALKAAFSEEEQKEISTKRRLITQREIELTDRLEQERRRLQELIRKANR